MAPGLGRNWRQFSLLVVVNAFVGAMVGLERAVLPLFAQREFGLASTSAMLSFIVSFGIVKAMTNLVAGRAAERFGRKPLLVAGWLAGLPVPFLLFLAPTWSWITAANVLLGLNQGLCWSTTVVMKIDLVGPRRRGFAMGLNEFAGYGAVALAAWASGFVASTAGVRMALFSLGLTFALAGLLLSVLFVRETASFIAVELGTRHADARLRPSFGTVFAEASLKNRTLFAVNQAGLVNNLNDGVAWGLFPILFASGGVDVRGIGVLVAIYPAVWGLSQIGTGALSDRWGRRWPIAAGMWIQAAALVLIAAAAGMEHPYGVWIGGSLFLGVGTALVYPTLLAAVSDAAHPAWRATAVGVYRLWRDLGYAVGALLSGFVADLYGMPAAIALVGVLTFASGVLSAVQMTEPRVAR